MEANSLVASATALATANQATLTLHDVRISRAQTTADAVASNAVLAQQAADQAQQTSCNAVNKTKHWDFTWDLHQPMLETTCSNYAIKSYQLIHINCCNKSLDVTDNILRDSLLTYGNTLRW